jgi:hypothetical protein
VKKMVEGNIEPKSVEAMENFKRYAEESNQSMKSLQQQMDKFTNSMAMTKVHSTDLRESLRQMTGAEPFKQMEDSIKEVQSGLEKTLNPRTDGSPLKRGTEPTGMTNANPEASNVTVNLRIDVSGVSDRSDKRALAKQISEMVTKEVRSKLGGSLSQSGFSRSG